jgi:hypothetical protein
MIDVQKVIRFCRSELGIMDSVKVEVSLEDLTEDNAHGWCIKPTDFHNFKLNAYDIELEETLNDEEMLVTLCHEMVHVRQYSEGDKSDEREAEELESVLADKYKKSFGS